MSGAVEFGKCQCCGKETSLQRKYFYYDIDCECCSAIHKGKKRHFEFIRHCNNCIPKEPLKINVSLKSDKYLIL